MLTIGSKAPDFTAPSTEGTISLSGIKGKKVLIFYPKDRTPGWAKQLSEARDALETYNKLDVHVLAVNPASLESHAEFAEIYKLNFPLITDEGGKICKEYGVSISLGMPKRTVYIVGADDTIHRGWEGMPGTEELLQALK